MNFVGDNIKVTKDNMFPVPPLFKTIQKQSATDYAEMYKVFNMRTEQMNNMRANSVEETVLIGNTITPKPKLNKKKKSKKTTDSEDDKVFGDMIKALFFDIDGTLVSFKTHRVPSSAIDALQAAKAKGIKIFISTGRPKAIINNLGELEELNLIDGYVSMNGAYCFVGDTVIERHYIPHESALKIGHFVDQVKAACVFVSAHDVCVYRENSLMRKIFYDYLHGSMPTVYYTAMS